MSNTALTDLQIFEAMLNRANIKYQRVDHEAYTILLIENKGGKFYISEISFYAEGNLMSVEAWG